MTWPLVRHAESDTSYCPRHFRVVDAGGDCASCLAEVPRRSVFIDPTAVMRWQELIDATTPDIITAIQRFVVEGREVEGTGKFATCRYFVHDSQPSAVVVAKSDGAHGGAVVTVMRLSTLEHLRAQAVSA